MSTKKRRASTKGTRESENPLRQHKHDGLARFITNTFGSLAFLIIYLVFIAGWICWNKGLISNLQPFDRFPFNKLELCLSTFAIFLTVMVLISQKRQARLEKINEQVEFEVNLRSEKEITKVLGMLQRIQQKLGIDHQDPELDQMMKDLDTAHLHHEQKQAEKA